LVTPRMHGIHHSDFENETNSNWSSLLTVWDMLHGTLLLNVSQQEIVIGVRRWHDRADATLGRILAQPFKRQRDDWTDDDGTLARREHGSRGRWRLAE
ncbi:MAG TPA: sterol desaturase family protein, partial [Thermoanaerobaculia bacterium]|nr:sterol desaturase family protein [Thermoanaerobaculia bacterium]